MKIKNLLSFMFAVVPLVASAQGIVINEGNFPDERFRNYLLEQDYGRDGIITEKEIENITEIDVSAPYTADNIYSLKGIEFFTALTSLDCSNNALESIDLSNNTKLTYLNFSINRLVSLDVSNNTELLTLVCDNNELTSLDVSNNKQLQQLHCFGNNLSSLDVSNNTALWDLDCNTNNLTSLDVSNNTNLSWFACSYNNLISLDVSNNTNLSWFVCSYNNLTSLDVSNNTALLSLSCQYNNILSLDVSNNINLQTLNCYHNQIRGSNMDALISGLPTNANATKQEISILYKSSDEGNFCSHSQVAAIRNKGWTPYYYEMYYKYEYDGTETVSVGADGLATYCSAFDVDFSDAKEIAAYKASVGEGVVLLTKVETVAAGEGVLLRSLNGGEVTEVLPIEEATKNDDNAFVGTFEATVLKEADGNVTNFLLSKVDGVVGFFKANDTRVPAWKAYLPVENYNAEASVKGLQIVFSDATGIVGVQDSQMVEDGAFYTLSGVRAANPKAKGIYIHNGKKVIIK